MITPPSSTTKSGCTPWSTKQFHNLLRAVLAAILFVITEGQKYGARRREAAADQRFGSLQK